MRSKAILFGGLAILAVVAGTYGLLRSRADASASDDAAPAQSVISVQVGALELKTLHHYVTGYGDVAAAPATASESAASAAVAAPVSGVVTAVKIAQGQQVKRGQMLVTLNSQSLTERYAEREVARQKMLYAQHNASLKALQSAEAQLTLLRVYAPLSGTVVAVNVKPGTAVDANTVLVRIVNLHRLVVTTDIPAAQAEELRPGQPVEVLGTPRIPAQLSYVSPTVDPTDGGVMAWAPLPAQSGLRPGQFVRLRIRVGTHPNALSAPAESVVSDLTGHSVISLVHGNEAIRVPVRVGYREDGWVEVSAPGLKPGDKVVTVGAYGLPQKAQIQVVPATETPAALASSESKQPQ